MGENKSCLGRTIGYGKPRESCPEGARYVEGSSDLRCGACHAFVEADMRERQPSLFEPWSPPEGMHDVPLYPDGIRVTQKGLARLSKDVLDHIGPSARERLARLLGESGRPTSDLSFWVGDDHEFAPALPLKSHGRHGHVGWDIPTRWAVDANGQCYMDGAHGGFMTRCPQKALLDLLRGDGGDDTDVRRLLGLKPRLPGWISMALHAGWTPPETFRREDYE